MKYHNLIEAKNQLTEQVGYLKIANNLIRDVNERLYLEKVIGIYEKRLQLIGKYELMMEKSDQQIRKENANERIDFMADPLFRRTQLTPVSYLEINPENDNVPLEVFVGFAPHPIAVSIINRTLKNDFLYKKVEHLKDDEKYNYFIWIALNKDNALGFIEEFKEITKLIASKNLN